MTVTFKHMTRKNAEKLSCGEIRIGSMAYYQETEQLDAIQDTLEGITVGRVEKTILTTQSDKPIETIVAGLKFVVASGGTINMGDVKFIRHLPPLYIFSTSLAEKLEHFKEYDTVIRINDIEAFGKILVNERRDLFNGFYANSVRYESRTYNALHHHGIEPDPFIKDTKFSQDKEFRLVFAPAAAVERHVTFHLNAIRQAFNDRLCELI